jgi:hypothetical protein
MRLSSGQDKEGIMAMEACQQRVPQIHKTKAPEAEDRLQRKSNSEG